MFIHTGRRALRAAQDGITRHCAVPHVDAFTPDVFRWYALLCGAVRRGAVWHRNAPHRKRIRCKWSFTQNSSCFP